MDPGEKLFKWLHSKKQERKSRHFSEFIELDIASTAYHERLDFVFSALQSSDGSAYLYLSDDLDYPDTSVLFLPNKLSLAPHNEGNFLFYIYRLMVYIGAVDAGFVKIDSYIGQAEALIYSMCNAPQIHRELCKRHGGFLDLLTQVGAMARHASAVFSDYNSSFIDWAKFIDRALSVEDFTLTNTEKSLLIKTWRKEWICSSYCPLHAISILPQPQRSAFQQQADGFRNIFSKKNTLPKAASAKNQDVDIKTSARPETKTMKEYGENPMTHVFEKLLTADEYKGGSKKQDGSDESQDQADALSELTLNSVVRSETETASILKSNAQINSFMPDIDEVETEQEEKLYTYPEWFEDQRQYKPDFCTVFESVAVASNKNYKDLEAGASAALSEKLSSFLNESRWKPRQKDGPEFDLDAIVRWRSQQKTSGPIEQRLYIGRRNLERNLAILILLDSSLSADAWINDKRVMDVMRSSVGIIGKAFSGLDDNFAVAAFNSHARTRCTFKWIKKFDDSWAKGSSRLYSVTPDGYTRIGPALRHAHAILTDIKARRKLILLFSDAKPSDYDRYEGQHGLNDVRKAVSKIKSQGIYLKGITVAQQSRANLVRMFGSGHYEVLSDSKQIPETIMQIFIEMMKK